MCIFLILDKTSVCKIFKWKRNPSNSECLKRCKIKNQIFKGVRDIGLPANSKFLSKARNNFFEISKTAKIARFLHISEQVKPSTIFNESIISLYYSSEINYDVRMNYLFEGSMNIHRKNIERNSGKSLYIALCTTKNLVAFLESFEIFH